MRKSLAQGGHASSQRRKTLAPAAIYAYNFLFFLLTDHRTMTQALFESTIKSLPLLGRGKVRDIYAVDADKLLIVTSDRLSAFDVVLPDPIPGQGPACSPRWPTSGSTKLGHIVPNQLTGIDPETVVARRRARPGARPLDVVVKKLKPLPIEAVVRGYLIGSGWKDYQKTGTVCGIKLPKGLQQAQKLPEPIFTPGHQGRDRPRREHLLRAARYGEARVGRTRRREGGARGRHPALQESGRVRARRRASSSPTPSSNSASTTPGTLDLIDEVLTADSSRFWPADSYASAVKPPSYDKQFVRDYLETLDWDKTPPAPQAAGRRDRPDARPSISRPRAADRAETRQLRTFTPLLSRIHAINDKEEGKMNDSPTPLDQHFALPDVRHIGRDRPLAWLKSGWQDMQANPIASLAYGLLFAIAGDLILLFAWRTPYLFTASVSGFFLIAPLLAGGLYEISRRRAKGQHTTFFDSLACWSRNGQSMAMFGMLLAFAAIIWERTSAVFFALLIPGLAPDLWAFVPNVLFNPDYYGLTLSWLLVGSILALLVFSVSAVSIPMLIDRDIDFVTGMMTSMRAVIRNPGTMLLWAGVVVALTLVGFVTLLFGLGISAPNNSRQ